MCNECTCSVPVAAGAICGEINKSVIDAYVSECRDSGCDSNRSYAFDELDLTEYVSLDLNQGNWSYSADDKRNYYCCQDGKNCSDGFAGCEPGCTACCDVEDCSRNIANSAFPVWICVDGSCIEAEVLIPYEFLGAQYRRNSNVDLITQSNSCTYLKSQRDTTGSISSACQSDASQYDDDFPCAIRFISFNSSSNNCPTNC